MKNFVYCLILIGILVLTGCISTSYKGKSYEATKELALYYSHTDIPKGDYQKIGILEISADTTCSSESIVNEIREESMARGADIAVVGWFDSRFVIEDNNHKKSCQTSHCHHDAKDKYKYKKLVKVVLIKIKEKSL
jgi:hypothetical protein